jgi:hypothetical protein
LPRDLHLVHVDIRPKLFSYCLDIRCVYLILSLFPTQALQYARNTAALEHAVPARTITAQPDSSASVLDKLITTFGATPFRVYFALQCSRFTLSVETEPHCPPLARNQLPQEHRLSESLEAQVFLTENKDKHEATK